MSTFKAQTFDYFLVLDFEATCSDDNKINPMEIIEFPVLKVSGQTFDVEATFHRYVRPTIFPELTPFCTKLTGITQSTVKYADPFPVVFDDFKRWMQNENLVNSQQKPVKQFTFVTCGNWDLGKMLPSQGLLSNCPIPDYMQNWIEIKKSFNARFGFWVKSQDEVIDYFKIVKVGRDHSGIDDCRNLLQIMRALASKDHHFVNNAHYRGIVNALNNRPFFHNY